MDGGKLDLQDPILQTAPALGQGAKSPLSFNKTNVIDQRQGINTVLPGSSTADTDIPVIATPGDQAEVRAL